MIDHQRLMEMAEQLTQVPGVIGVALGGSRARGDAVASSDVDLGVYYDSAYDSAALNRLAGEWDSAGSAAVGEPGSWGPWVNAGAWLRVDGVAVDWILRDWSRVQQAWSDAQQGRCSFHTQPGHPLGFLDVSYAGEVALSRILSDPTGAIGELKAAAQHYPAALVNALNDGLWEATFLVELAHKGAAKSDVAYVSMCLSRALMLVAHALNARAGRWVTNEKGLVPGVASLGADGVAVASAQEALVGLRPEPGALVAAAKQVGDVVREASSQKQVGTEIAGPL